MQLENEKVQITNGINKWFLRTIAKGKKKKIKKIKRRRTGGVTSPLISPAENQG